MKLCPLWAAWSTWIWARPWPLWYKLNWAAPDLPVSDEKNCPSQFKLPDQVETRTALYLPILMKLCLPLSTLVRMKLGPPLNSTVLILGVSVFPKFVQWRKIYVEFVLKLTLRRRKEEVKVVSVGEFPLCFSVTPGTLCIAWFISLFREIGPN
jgi:hypothetical protein